MANKARMDLMLGLWVAIALGAGAAEEPRPTLGRLEFETAGVFSPPVPVEAGWVRTAAEPARLELSIDRVLHLAVQTTIHLRSIEPGAVEVIVAGGKVEVPGLASRPLVAGQNSVFVLRAPSGDPASTSSDTSPADLDEPSDDRFVPPARPYPSLARED